MRRGPSASSAASAPRRAARAARLRVLFVASEATPFAKTGGLGDVISALAQAVARLGHDVRILMPLYRGVPRGRPALRPASAAWALPAPARGTARFLRRTGPGEGAETWFLDAPELYDRDGLYQAGGRDHPDNLRRFSTLCQAAVRLAAGWPADVVHAHDWQAALACAHVRWGRRGPRPATVLTIHNLAYQGLFPFAQWPETGLPPEAWSSGDLEFYGQINCLKGGLVSADRLTTVSPTYAREIQTAAFGCGLDGVLRARGGALEGLLNGIDTASWNPATDTHLAARYTAARPAGKAACAQALRAELGLPTGGLLIGMVLRLVEQKGVRLFLDSLEALLSLPVHVALLGTGDAVYHQALARAAGRHPGRLAVRLAFDEALARRITAGADAFLMPSQFEPCGLNQMYSMRYGTVPIVRKVGGLADTVVDEAAGAAATGFVFEPYAPTALIDAVQRAATCFSEGAARWRALMRAGMRRDFSWETSAARYVQVYQAVAAARVA